MSHENDPSEGHGPVFGDRPSDPARYLGLPGDEAEQRARSDGWTTVRQLPPDAVVTMEYLAGRLNLVVKDGAVSRSWAG